MRNDTITDGTKPHKYVLTTEDKNFFVQKILPFHRKCQRLLKRLVRTRRQTRYMYSEQ